MKKCLFLFFWIGLVAQENVLSEDELALQREVPTFSETFSSPISPPEPLINRPLKSPSTALLLSGIFPGLGHFYLGDSKTAGGLMGIAGVELGALAASVYERRADAAVFSLLTFSNTVNYGIYAAYRDARLYNGQEGYKYKMPADQLAELSAAPFRWSVLKKPEVWGGCLGALSVSYCMYRFAFPEKVRASSTSHRSQKVQPWFSTIALPVGIGEESFFRGFLQPCFSEYLTPWGSIVATSLLFGAAHIPNAQIFPKESRWRYYSFSLPLITGLGGYLGWLTQKNTSLKESVAVHTWYDFILIGLQATTQSAAIGCPVFDWSGAF